MCLTHTLNQWFVVGWPYLVLQIQFRHVPQTQFLNCRSLDFFFVNIITLYFLFIFPHLVLCQDLENKTHMAQIITFFQMLLVLLLHDYISAEDGETRASRSQFLVFR